MTEGAAQVEQVIVEHDEHRQQINTKNDERSPNRAAHSDAPEVRALRFNFSQHNTLTGESSSWAGPVDFRRNDCFFGPLLFRESQTSGMHGN
jgi:hypothetical protein